MQFAICCVPVSPLRKEPSHQSEMISQQLFGEVCILLEESNKWIKIKCKYDGYEGWCQPHHVTEVSKDIYYEENVLLASDPFNLVNYNDQPMTIPIGSSLPGLKNSFATWGDNIIEYEGKVWNNKTALINDSTIHDLSVKFLNTSYLWGGKSIFGIDCSGFTQIIFKFLNIPLLRDAYLQATQGHDIGFLQLINAGDLAFFDNDEGRITHVGILLNEQTIIHSSEKVRIDRIDNDGIINNENNFRTHRLRMIKRYF
jgi:gamma-D-glutamyl-L-lysine dipeptidyl-peptidase